ncbi:MAG: hypothetical protein U1F68_00885 [Gammaproteobacteria bacterium]
MSEVIEDLRIENEEDYRRVQATLSRQNRPPAVLRFMMRLFESYRASRRIGWSRPWNKYGVTNFQSFKLVPAEDQDLLDCAAAVLRTETPAMPEPVRAFAAALLAEREALMGFIFVHETTDTDGRRFESVNLSLGRRALGQPRYRDRLDLVFDSPVINGESTGFARLRIYADPYRAGAKEALWSTVLEQRFDAPAIALFQRLATLSWEWAELPGRAWNHWTSAYIDYFGPRQWAVRKSYFFVPGAPEARIGPAGRSAAIAAPNRVSAVS